MEIQNKVSPVATAVNPAAIGAKKGLIFIRARYIPVIIPVIPNSILPKLVQLIPFKTASIAPVTNKIAPAKNNKAPPAVVNQSFKPNPARILCKPDNPLMNSIHLSAPNAAANSANTGANFSPHSFSFFMASPIFPSVNPFRKSYCGNSKSNAPKSPTSAPPPPPPPPDFGVSWWIIFNSSIPKRLFFNFLASSLAPFNPLPAFFALSARPPRALLPFVIPL